MCRVILDIILFIHMICEIHTIMGKCEVMNDTKRRIDLIKIKNHDEELKDFVKNMKVEMESLDVRTSTHKVHCSSDSMCDSC